MNVLRAAVIPGLAKEFVDFFLLKQLMKMESPSKILMKFSKCLGNNALLFLKNQEDCILLHFAFLGKPFVS